MPISELVSDANESAAQSPPTWPVYDEDEIECVVRVMRSGKVNYWTGQECRLFEQEFAQRVGTRHAVAVANGTVALELALHAFGIGAGDEVIVPCRTFMATASCAAMCGAIPIVADVDLESQNITASTIAPRITPATRAIIVVHLAGWPCDMDPIMALAGEHGLIVIEDCAQAHGAKYKGREVGSIGDAAAFSFCQDKIITTAGEGGLLTTNDSEVYERAWAYKDHGKSYDAVHRRNHGPGFRWLHESFGTNWRMTEIQAAVGRVQLKKLDRWLASRQCNAAILNAELNATPGLRLTIPNTDVYHAFYRYYAFLEFEQLALGWDKQRVLDAITAQGIPCYSGSCGEIYREKAFPSHLRPPQPFPNARMLDNTGLCLRVDPVLAESDMRASARAVKKALHAARRATGD